VFASTTHVARAELETKPNVHRPSYRNPPPSAAQTQRPLAAIPSP